MIPAGYIRSVTNDSCNRPKIGLYIIHLYLYCAILVPTHYVKIAGMNICCPRPVIHTTPPLSSMKH